jgi:hypothetical protein
LSHSAAASEVYTGLKREPPAIDYEEFKTHLSPVQLAWATAELLEISEIIKRSTRGPNRGALDATRAPTRAPSQALSRQSLGSCDSERHQVLPDAHPTPRTSTESEDRREREDCAGADGSPLAGGWGHQANISSEVERVQGAEAKTFLSAFVHHPEAGQDWGLLFSGREYSGQLPPGVLERQATHNPFLQHGHFKAHSVKDLDATITPARGGGATYTTCTDVTGAFTTQALSEEPLEIEGPWAEGMCRPLGLTASPDLGCFNTLDPEFETMAPHGFQTITSMFGFAPNPFNWQKAHSLPQDY